MKRPPRCRPRERSDVVTTEWSRYASRTPQVPPPKIPPQVPPPTVSEQNASESPETAEPQAPAPAGDESRRASRGSLLVIFLTVFIDLLGFGIVLPLLPIYARSFAVDESGWEIALLMASFSIMQFLVAPFWGRLSDRIGRRPVLMVGLSGSVVFYTLFGIATVRESMALLFVSRIGAGIAGATISTAHAYIADVTPHKERTRGMALIGAAFGLGFTFGPLFGFFALIGSPDKPGPGPGYAAAALSLVALLMAIFLLPESLNPQRKPQKRTWMTFTALTDAIGIPSIGLLLATTFICVVAFGSFESTLSLLLKDEQSGMAFNLREVLLTFTYIGLTLALVQGGIVRPLARRINEPVLASSGTLIMMAGLALLALAQQTQRNDVLYVALAVCVAGFAFITPSLNSLISRRSDPGKQGGILGLTQSISSLGRIVGPLVGIPLFYQDVLLPMWAGIGLLGLALVLVLIAAPRGRDYPAEAESAEAA